MSKATKARNKELNPKPRVRPWNILNAGKELMEKHPDFDWFISRHNNAAKKWRIKGKPHERSETQARSWVHRQLA